MDSACNIGVGTVGAVGAAAPTKHFKGGIAPTRFSQTYTRQQEIEVQKLVGLLSNVLEVLGCLS